MKKHFKPITFGCLTAVIFLAIQCENGRVVSTPDKVLSGIIYKPTGQPAVNVAVVIRPHDYLPEIRQLPEHTMENNFSVWSTRTDSKGKYRFTTEDSIPRGLFIIEARDDSGNCANIGNMEIDSVLYFNYATDDSPYEFNSTLKPPGMLKGAVHSVNSAADVLVKVFGLDAYAKVTADSSFLLKNIPQGSHTLQFLTIGNDTLYDTLNVAVSPGTTTDIGTFIPSVYRVGYNGNGNTAGTMPVDNEWHNTGEELTVSGNPGNLARAGFSFAGWNTKEDGTGIPYAAGDTLIKGAQKVTLYAQWSEYRYLLTVADSGDGTAGGTDSVAHGVPHPINATHEPGYHFSVWRVTNGTAVIADSFASSTTVTLKSGDATVQGIFHSGYTFIKSISGTDALYGSWVQQTGDGGFIIVGNTTWNGEMNTDVCLIKTGADGNVMWNRAYTGYGRHVRQTGDGGYIIVGNNYTSTATRGSDIYIIKTTATGDTMWTRTYGGTSYDEGKSIQQTNDGGYIISGQIGGVHSAACLIKTDEHGDSIWTASFDLGVYDNAFSVQQTADGGYIIGDCAGPWDYSIYLIKTDEHGDSVWTKAFSVDIPLVFPKEGTVQQTGDGGYIIEYASDDGFVYLTKIDQNGKYVWNNTIGTTSVFSGSCIQQTSDEGYVFAGNIYYVKPFVIDCFLIKTSSNGEVVWNKSFGRADFDVAYSVQQTTDGGYIITGETRSSEDGPYGVLLIKTDENGNVN